MLKTCLIISDGKEDSFPVYIPLIIFAWGIYNNPFNQWY